jgi:hypothetical protein
MVTNDEINKRKLKIAKYLKENFLVCGFDTAAILELVDEIEDLARRNTSNQIFAEFDKTLKRGRMLKREGKVYDSVKYKVHHGLIIEDEKEYQEIKKKYKVD